MGEFNEDQVNQHLKDLQSVEQGQPVADAKPSFALEASQRLKAKTPTFWQQVGKIGLIIASVGGVIATAPVALPASIVAIGGYLATAGGVLTVVSRFGADTNEIKPE